jgi:hypothetical protein
MEFTGGWQTTRSYVCWHNGENRLCTCQKSAETVAHADEIIENWDRQSR